MQLPGYGIGDAQAVDYINSQIYSFPIMQATISDYQGCLFVISVCSTGAQCGQVKAKGRESEPFSLSPLNPNLEQERGNREAEADLSTTLQKCSKRTAHQVGKL